MDLSRSLCVAASFHHVEGACRRSAAVAVAVASSAPSDADFLARWTASSVSRRLLGASSLACGIRSPCLIPRSKKEQVEARSIRYYVAICRTPQRSGYW